MALRIASLCAGAAPPTNPSQISGLRLQTSPCERNWVSKAVKETQRFLCLYNEGPTHWRLVRMWPRLGGCFTLFVFEQVISRSGVFSVTFCWRLAVGGWLSRSQS
jgi:hypothetical protein